MKIISTPPKRYRPRKDYEGPASTSVSFAYGKVVYIGIRGNGEDRHWRIELGAEEWAQMRDAIDRSIERRH